MRIQANFVRNTPQAQRAVRIVLLLALGASLAWAYVLFSQPLPTLLPSADTGASGAFRADRSAQARLLGDDPSAAGAPPPYAVVGVMVGPSGQGSAVLSVDGQSMARQTGQEVSAGWVLEAVGSEAITVSKAGIKHRIQVPSTPPDPNLIRVEPR